MDISINGYRSSPDSQRLNEATHGEALAANNGLYISMADGFQSHNSKTQSITGDLIFKIVCDDHTFVLSYKYYLFVSFVLSLRKNYRAVSVSVFLLCFSFVS